MPKIVDHEQRRRDLTEALWRVVAKSGASAVSIRTVAAEAGWSAGALRHYFPTRNALLEFALEEAEQQVTQRIKARANDEPGEEPPERAAALIEELLPFDEQRRAEFRLWQAVGEEFHEAHDQGNQRRWNMQRLLYRKVAQTLCGDTPPEAGGQREQWLESCAEYLHVFCDGLSIQLMSAPAQVPPEEARRLLRRYLTDLASGPAGNGRSC